MPPNVRFEIDDCLEEWTWGPASFDFVHIRYLFGAVPDWNVLFQKAYDVLTPGGYLQSCECDVEIVSDDNSIPPDSTMATVWNDMFRDAGKVLGNSFTVLEDNLQRKGCESAGFEDIKEINFKVGRPCYIAHWIVNHDTRWLTTIKAPCRPVAARSTTRRGRTLRAAHHAQRH